MNEREWLEYLKKYLYEKPPVIATYNEDATVIEIKENHYLLLTTDTLVEGIHFDLAYFDFYSLGVKLAASNLSDIAAMGGWPKWALLTLGSPKPIDPSFIDPFMEGLVSTLGKYSAYSTGGDTVRSPFFFFSLTLVGETEKPLLRKGAKKGDYLFVSRALGGSSAFLRWIKEKPLDQIPENLKKAHLRPEPEIELGLILRNIASSAIDISDGLLLDLSRLCIASQVSAEIEEEKIPLEEGATLEEALSGGEDYALLFTIPEKNLPYLTKINKRIFYLGRIIEGVGEILFLTKKGERKRLPPKGFDHFTFLLQS
ncbi:MAG: thiamine-phosphate kinase [Caldimicrobium sp.]|jgi:thiamine-monophosphate kinase